MIKWLALSIATFLFSTHALAFSSANHGIGLAVGEPGGVTVFFRTSDRAFVQGYVGQNLLLGVDYNFAFAGSVKTAQNVTPYLGVGGVLFTDDHWTYPRDKSGFAIRMPAGILIQIPEAPFHFHLEVAPTSTISPFLYSYASLMAGVRFLF